MNTGRWAQRRGRAIRGRARALNRRLLAPCVHGMKANLRPALALQAFALAILLAYYGTAAGRTWLDGIGELKARYGFAYSALATCAFGGILPYLVLLASGKIARASRGCELAFYLLFWCWKGIEVDAFYRLQALWFGAGNDFRTIALKVAVDQLGYAPIISAPVQVLCFLWKDSGFSLAATRAALARQSLWQRTLVVVFSTWVVWIPAVTIIYALPGALQIPLFNLVLCFWCLLMSFLSRSDSSQLEPMTPAAELDS